MDAKSKFQDWVLRTYTGSVKTKTITAEKCRRILSTLKGEIRNSADNSKFRFWMRSKGFRIGDNDQLLVVSPTGVGYKRVAVVEEFYDIIYGVHVVDVGTKSGIHAGQKKTYRAVTERFAFLPREAVTKFLLGCTECQRRVDAELTPLSSRYHHPPTVSDYLPINLTTKNCVIRLSVPNFKNDSWRGSSTPTKRLRMSSSSDETPEISPISTDDSLCLQQCQQQPQPRHLKQEMRVSPDPEVDEEVNGRNGDARSDAEDIWTYNLAKKQPSTPQRDLSSPLQESGSVHDETSSSGNKDDDDDDEEDDLKAPHHDSERLKAFNMFVRLFVDENLDRCVPISRQPKEKVQAIIDSCTRQFPEFGERARKRIRTYLKSCRRNKRSRDSGSWPDPTRPTPAHLTSVQAEQILAAACENESHNAKRMRLGLEPVSQPMPVIAGVEPRASIVDHFSPANLSAEPKLLSHLGASALVANASTVTIATVANAATCTNNNNIVSKAESPSYVKPTDSLTKTVSASMGPLTSGVQTFRSGTAALFSPATHAQTFMSPGLPLFHPGPIPNGPQDLSMKPSRPLLPQKLTGPEVSAVRQLITGYRESAAFLLRSADELESLLLQQS